jgi:hypothetical protein
MDLSACFECFLRSTRRIQGIHWEPNPSKSDDVATMAQVKEVLEPHKGQWVSFGGFLSFWLSQIRVVRSVGMVTLTVLGWLWTWCDVGCKMCRLQFWDVAFSFWTPRSMLFWHTFGWFAQFIFDQLPWLQNDHPQLTPASTDEILTNWDIFGPFFMIFDVFQNYPSTYFLCNLTRGGRVIVLKMVFFGCLDRGKKSPSTYLKNGRPLIFSPQNCEKSLLAYLVLVRFRRFRIIVHLFFVTNFWSFFRKKWRSLFGSFGARQNLVAYGVCPIRAILRLPYRARKRFIVRPAPALRKSSFLLPALLVCLMVTRRNGETMSCNVSGGASPTHRCQPCVVQGLQQGRYYGTAALDRSRLLWSSYWKPRYKLGRGGL